MISIRIGLPLDQFLILNNEAKIYVTDRNTGKELIQANTKIDIDPLITYLGVGYRF